MGLVITNGTGNIEFVDGNFTSTIGKNNIRNIDIRNGYIIIDTISWGGSTPKWLKFAHGDVTTPSTADLDALHSALVTMWESDPV